MAKLGVALLEARTGAPPPQPAPAAGGPAAANGAVPMDTEPGRAGAGAPGGAHAAAADGEAGLRVAGGDAGAGPGAEREGDAVKPRAFKALVGRGHPEFSSARQQARRTRGPSAAGRRRLPSCYV